MVEMFFLKRSQVEMLLRLAIVYLNNTILIQNCRFKQRRCHAGKTICATWPQANVVCTWIRYPLYQAYGALSCSAQGRKSG
jgi:hypothetical protein